MRNRKLARARQLGRERSSPGRDKLRTRVEVRASESGSWAAALHMAGAENGAPQRDSATCTD